MRFLGGGIGHKATRLIVKIADTLQHFFKKKTAAVEDPSEMDNEGLDLDALVGADLIVEDDGAGSGVDEDQEDGEVEGHEEDEDEEGGDEDEDENENDDEEEDEDGDEEEDEEEDDEEEDLGPEDENREPDGEYDSGYAAF